MPCAPPVTIITRSSSLPMAPPPASGRRDQTGDLQHTRFARRVKELGWTPRRRIAFGPLKLYHRRRGGPWGRALGAAAPGERDSYAYAARFMAKQEHAKFSCHATRRTLLTPSALPAFDGTGNLPPGIYQAA